MLLEGDAIDGNPILIAVINLFYKICMDFTVHVASGFQPMKKWFQSKEEVRSPQGPRVPSAGTGTLACGSCLCSLGKGRHISQASSPAGGGPPAHPLAHSARTPGCLGSRTGTCVQLDGGVRASPAPVSLLR